MKDKSIAQFNRELTSINITLGENQIARQIARECKAGQIPCSPCQIEKAVPAPVSTPRKPALSYKEKARQLWEGCKFKIGRHTNPYPNILYTIKKASYTAIHEISEFGVNTYEGTIRKVDEHIVQIEYLKFGEVEYKSIPLDRIEIIK